jgi:predicted SAM-dependent methyltransferase
MRPGFRNEFAHLYSPDKRKNLNLGSGGDIDPEFTNLDWSNNHGADMVWDLENTPLPFESNRFRLIVASHVLEHVSNYIALMDEIYRILEPGGRIVIYVPYYTSVDAWASPEHVRVFSESSWEYLNQRVYRNPGCGNYDTKVKCNFDVDYVVLQVDEKFKKQKNVRELICHQWNVVKEMCAILRKENND